MSVWDDISNTAEEAENLRVRAKFMRAIRKVIESHSWDQSTAASQLGLTQPRVSALMTGKISQFSLDALINIGVKLDIHADVVQSHRITASA